MAAASKASEIERKNPQDATDVEVAQAVALTEGVPEAAGDEKAGEREEQDEADPAGLGEEADDADGGLGGLEASAVMEDEDHQDGEAAEAVEGAVAAGFGNGRGGSSGIVEGRIGDGFAEGCVGGHFAQRSELGGLRQLRRRDAIGFFGKEQDRSCGGRDRWGDSGWFGGSAEFVGVGVHPEG